MNIRRWKRAQKAEKNYWLLTKKDWLHENSRKYWLEKLARGFNLNYEFFNGKSVLDVGCGPNGIIYQLDNVRSRVGLEPMDLDDLVLDEWTKSIVKKGVGEKMPFDDNSFDVVLSLNSLDHCINPTKVIQEINRVLRNEGDFLLWMYTLRDHYSPLRYFLNKFDSPHPFHLTYNEVLVLVNSFGVKVSRQDKGTNLPNNTIRKVIGNCMMDTLWLWLVKKNFLQDRSIIGNNFGLRK